MVEGLVVIAIAVAGAVAFGILLYRDRRKFDTETLRLLGEKRRQSLEYAPEDAEFYVLAGDVPRYETALGREEYPGPVGMQIRLWEDVPRLLNNKRKNEKGEQDD